jgi:tetratricopeptide (TPR) repeat protein
VEYAYRHKESYPYVFWVNALSDVTLSEGFVKIAYLLRLIEKDEADQGIVVEAVKNWLTQHDGWLLILDNADELSIVARYFPPEPRGHILITTRTWVTNPLAQSFPVENMTTEDGVLFLLQRAALLNHPASLSQIHETDYTFAATIVQEMDGLPLALDQAGAYIAETSCSLAEYLTAYRNRKASLLARRSYTSQYPTSVATTWKMAFEEIEKRDPIAAELLNVLTFLAPDAIAEEILIAGASKLGPQLQPLAEDPTLLNDACAALRRFSLVQRDSANHLLSIHRLVQAVLQLDMDEQTKRTWEERTILAVNRAFPYVEQKAWPQCERLVPHVLHCTRFSVAVTRALPQAVRLFHKTAWYLQERAQYSEAEPLYQQALHIDEKALGLEHPYTAYTMQTLASLHQELGRYSEAEAFYQQALRIYQKTLDPGHPNIQIAQKSYTSLQQKMQQQN